MQTLTAAQLAIVVRLYRLGRTDRPASLARLARDLQRPAEHLAEDLAILDRAGLVDATRVRLTLSGLCVAASVRVKRAPQLRHAA